MTGRSRTSTCWPRTCACSAISCGPMIAGDADEGRALGRLDDLEAQLVALDGDLRQLATTFSRRSWPPGSLADGLRLLTEAFAERTGVLPRTHLRGSLTEPDRLPADRAVVADPGGALQHPPALRRRPCRDRDRGRRRGCARGGHRRRRRLRSRDRPCARAARAGRLGLVGMHERVRMLGGSTRIDSRPGGPTVISASLPAVVGRLTTAGRARASVRRCSFSIA